MKTRVLLASASLLVAGMSACKKDAAEDADQRAGKATQRPAPAPEPPAAVPATPPPQAAHPDSPMTSPVGINLAEVRWQEGPDSLPKGARFAVLEGSPPFPAGKTFTILLRFPPSYAVPPHIHAVTERVTVLSGSASLGHGRTLDRKAAKRVEQGALVMVPARHPHYVFTGKDEVIVSLQGVGPWAIEYIDPADDPRQPPVPLPAPAAVSFDTEIEPVVVNAREIEYAPAPPDLLPPGAQLAALEGTPPFAEQKTFLVRIKVPDGYRFPVHRHGITDRFTILSGTLRHAVGDTWDEAALVDMKPGSVTVLPAGNEHYAVARGETVLQVFGVGPFDLRWSNPEDDPAKRAK
jgi:mannose-6-phosphate isomerase-like protein (cupin superfamily)